MNNLNKIKNQKAVVIREIEKLEKELIEKDVTMICSSENIECTPLKDLKEAIEECWIVDKDNNSIDIDEDTNIQVGDCIVYDYKYGVDKLAIICENADNKFQVYFPMYKMIDHQITDSLEELRNSWIESCDEDVKFIRVTDENINDFELECSYLLFNEGTHEIVKCKVRKVGGGYALYGSNNEENYCANSTKDLFLKVLYDYPIVRKIRDNNDRYNLLNDDVCKQLAEKIFEYYDEITQNIKLDNYQMVDLGENIIKYSRLSKQEILKILNDIDIAEYKWDNEILKTTWNFFNGLGEYFYEDLTLTWYPNNLGIFPGCKILNPEDNEVYEVILINNKYTLCNNRTNKMYESMYDTIKDMVDDILDCSYDEILNGEYQ